MSNFVTNYIIISGPKENIKRLVAHILAHKNGECYNLSSFEKKAYPQTFLDYDTTNYPDGERLENLSVYKGHKVTPRMIYKFKRATRYQKECFGVVGWYDYNIKHFGCKWDSTIDELVYNFKVIDNKFFFVVSTPWSIPLPWLERVSREWKVTVHCDYEEEFNNFEPGSCEFEDGESTLDV